ncbi:hypothetical protein [Paractinoplanes durhamensis]|uniref:hypothetical protein n=1 Tax=Paractinoplanes durhamensis TaxID=113563 RepID=UPI00363F88C0
MPLSVPTQSRSFGTVVQYHLPPATSAAPKITVSVAPPLAVTVRVMSGNGGVSTLCAVTT